MTVIITIEVPDEMLKKYNLSPSHFVAVATNSLVNSLHKVPGVKIKTKVK